MGQQSITPPLIRLAVPLWVAALLFLFSGRIVRSQTPANAAPVVLPSAVVFDAHGNFYIAETGNHVIRKVDTAGDISTIAGNGRQGFSGDGGMATAAELDSPQGLALDGDQILYIVDTHNHRIRKLDLSTGLITTIAGGTAGFSGDNGPATTAHLDLPTALAVDTAHNLYIADTQNHRIRKIAAATRIITTVAGNGIQGFSGDNGPAISASIDSPTGMSVDSAGDLFLADTHNQRIRKIAAITGIISTVAGNGLQGFSGDSSRATAASLALPRGVSVDPAGNLYIADTANHRIRRVDAASSMISTVGGDGVQTFSGDNGPAAQAGLDSPRNIAISPAGLLTFADTGNQRIRQLSTQSGPSIGTIAGLSPAIVSALSLDASPALVYGSGQLSASLASTTATGSIVFKLLDPGSGAPITLGSEPLNAGAAAYDLSALPAGSYMLIAAYSGDSTHASVQSPSLPVQIAPRPLFIIPSPVTLLYGQPIPPFTGTISGVLPQDSGSVIANFTAAATALAPAGIYPISVSLTGGAAKSYTFSASPASLTIKPAPTITTLTAAASSLTSGTPLTLTTHIASTTTGTPTGPVSLMDGTTPLLSAIPSGGDATFVTSNLAPGTHILSSLFKGDKNFLSSISSPALVTVVAGPTNSADFSLTPTGATSLTIPSGGTANFNFAVQIQSSTLSSPIALSVTGLPALATASFNPAYLPPGTTPNNFVLTITTPQTSAFQQNPGTVPPCIALLLFPMAGIALRPQAISKAKKRFAFAIFTSVLIFCSGCGSRINTGDPAVNPIKTYTITVTGTATSPTGGTLQHSATIKLSVQSAT